MKLETNIIINAPVADVWQIFSDFETYPQWNPFVKALNGVVEEGEQIAIQLPGMNFKPKVLKYTINKEMRWKGKLGIPGIFDGEHYFILEEMSPAETRFIHGEKFSGILVPFMKKKIKTDVREGFESMNVALKNRVEER